MKGIVDYGPSWTVVLGFLFCLILAVGFTAEKLLERDERPYDWERDQ